MDCLVKKRCDTVVSGLDSMDVSEFDGKSGVGKTRAADEFPLVPPTLEIPKMGISFADATRGQRSVQNLKRVVVQLDWDSGCVSPESLAERGIHRRQNTLVGVIFGRKIPLVVIDHIVRRMWKN